MAHFHNRDKKMEMKRLNPYWVQDRVPRRKLREESPELRSNAKPRQIIALPFEALCGGGLKQNPAYELPTRKPPEMVVFLFFHAIFNLL